MLNNIINLAIDAKVRYLKSYSIFKWRKNDFTEILNILTSFELDLRWYFG